MKNKHPLVSLGLTEEEIIIYEVLLTKGALSPTELCAYTKLHRPSMYLHLELLQAKNLVGTIPSGKRKKYSANSPKQLKELSQKQEKSIQEEIIRLEELVETPKNPPRIVVRSGFIAIRKLYEEMVGELGKGDIYYRYASIDNDNWVPGKYATPKSIRIRNAKDLERYIITNEETHQRKAKNPNRRIKIVPKKFDLFRHNVGQVLYNDKVVIIDYVNELAVIIESKEIASFQKALFKTFFSYL